MKIILTPRYKFLILLWDLMVFLIVSGLLYSVRFQTVEISFFYSPGYWFICFSLVLNQYLFGNYDLDHSRSFKPLFQRQLLSVLMTVFLVLSVNYLLGKERAGVFGRGVFMGTLGVFTLLSLMYRWGIWKKLTRFFQKQKYLFLIEDGIKAFIEREVFRKYPLQKEVVSLTAQSLDSSALPQLLNDWTSIIVSLSPTFWQSHFTDKMMSARFRGNEVQSLESFIEETQKKVPIDILKQEWFIFETGFSLIHNPQGLRIKRIVDLFLALGLLFVTWPIILLAAFLIKLESPGPVFYQQVRTGLNGREFTIYKLRSMSQNAEKSGAQWAQTNDARVTRVGKWLRKTRIDEIPQLINVLRGDMSFIGPRPERPVFNKDLERQIAYYNLRHLVRPGITGWAQVMYPYGASVEDSKEKLQYDLYYIKNFSFILDARIILKTLQVVIFGKGR